MHRLRSLSYIAALSLTASCSLGSGEHTKTSTADTGGLQVSLLAASDIDIKEVSYSVQVPEHNAIQGTLPVGADGKASGEIADVPASAGVVVSLTASTAGGGVCSGEGTVAVVAGQTTGVAIVLQCHLPDGTPITTGTIEVTGTFNICPQVLAAAADPTSTSTTAALTSNASDLNGDTLTVAWSATSGTFADAAAGNTTYTCGSAGAQTLTVTVDDGKGCTNSKTVSVTCTGVTPPTPVCGDGKVDAGEQCDDGNTAAGDGCSATCTTEAPAAACGDGKVDTGEQCDDGNTAAGDGCSATCTTEAPAPKCGDGKVDAGEQCDDGNTAAGDGCSATCTTEAPTGPANECSQPRPLADACAECVCTSCAAETAACDGATGVAEAGPGKGKSKAQLCQDLVDCGNMKGCRGDACITPCQDQVVAAAEVDDLISGLTTIIGRKADTSYAIGLAGAVSTCSVNSCASACTAADAGTPTM